MSDNNTGDRRRADLKKRWLQLGDELETALAAGNERLVRRLERQRDRIGSDFAAENRGLATVVARKFFASNSRANHDDYVSSALMGLWEAFKLWDPAQSTFGNFSRQYIEGRVNRSVASAEAQGISYGDFSARQKVRIAEAKLAERLHRTPTNEEVAEESEQTITLVERVRRAQPVSLDTPVGDGESVLGDLVVETPDDSPEAGLLFGKFDPQDPTLRTQIAGEVPVVAKDPEFEIDERDRRLTPAELAVYARRHGIDAAPEQTLNGIGAMVEMGRETVRRHEKSAKAKVRAILTGEALPSQSTKRVVVETADQPELADA